jgi:ISSag3, transposase
MFEIIPSYKTIYNYIEKGILQIKNIDLPLKVKRKARNKIGIKNKKIYGTSISQRPQYIEQRQEFGHWEGDTVQGKKKKRRSNHLASRKEDKIQYICESKG